MYMHVKTTISMFVSITSIIMKRVVSWVNPGRLLFIYCLLSPHSPRPARPAPHRPGRVCWHSGRLIRCLLKIQRGFTFVSSDLSENWGDWGVFPSYDNSFILMKSPWCMWNIYVLYLLITLLYGFVLCDVYSKQCSF